MSKFTEIRNSIYRNIAKNKVLEDFILKYSPPLSEEYFQAKRKENALNAPKYARDTKYYLSVVAILKDEALYIKEWLDYHISMGVDHFYLYNNDSTDNLMEVIEPYLCDTSSYCNNSKKCVTLISYPGKARQVAAYNDALEKFKEESRWLAYIDLDEFICPSEKISLPEFLKDYESYPALVLNWQLFDTNNHKTPPEGGVLKNYTRVHKLYNRFKENCHIKSIIDPMRTKECLVHHHRYLNQNAVDENYRNMKTALSSTQNISKIRVNHYFMKSEEELILRCT